jgi:hypothetical protein
MRIRPPRSHFSESLLAVASWLKTLLLTRILYVGLAIVGLAVLVALSAATRTRARPLTDLAVLSFGPLLLLVAGALFRAAARVPPSQKALPPVLRGAPYRDRPASYPPPRVLLAVWWSNVLGAAVMLWRHSDQLVSATILVSVGVGAISAAYVCAREMVEERWREAGGAVSSR